MGFLRNNKQIISTTSTNTKLLKTLKFSKDWFSLTLTIPASTNAYTCNHTSNVFLRGLTNIQHLVSDITEGAHILNYIFLALNTSEIQEQDST